MKHHSLVTVGVNAVANLAAARIKNEKLNRATPSKSQEGECKNTYCTNKHRHGSAFCQECSDNHHNI